MDERSALTRLTGAVSGAGDDAAVVDGLVLTTDMLHESTDFPAGTTRYTAGWRAVGASLSDVAAMGGDAVATVAVYATPEFEWDELAAFVEGATDVSGGVGAEYVGGDLDSHGEFTVASTALGRADSPVWRSGAGPGDVVCVTGTLGRSAAALRRFEAGDYDRANELFRFQPRVDTGRRLAPHATAMIDSSDGLARSLHHLADESGCGFAVESPLPVAAALDAATEDADERRELSRFFGEDFELVCTLPESRVREMREATNVALTPIGTAVADGVTLDGEPLPDRGYTH
jgi:thiamine-monophosphate kinase